MKNVIGHEENKSRFAKALSRDRLPSTFLFVGPEGIGKRTFAIELAKSLLCEGTDQRELNYCGSCDSCQMIDNGNHPDFEYVAKLANKRQLVIEQFIGDREHRNREGLCYNFSLKPNRGIRRIAIIDDADDFGQESANCLLKILEEPPPRSVMIMIGTSVDKLLPTLRSRSQLFHFGRLSDDEVLAILETLDLSEIPESLDEVARSCEGSLLGLTHFLEEGLLEFRDSMYRALASLEPMADGFAKQFSGFIDQAGKEAAKRRDRFQLLADFAIEFYSVLARKLAGVQTPIPDSLRGHVDSAFSKWKGSLELATDCVERCLDVQRQIARNANQSTLIESWLSDLGKISRGDEIYAALKVGSI